ncbi:MAG: 4-hydroxy-3-methylbut-2-enyl diphosphate reductase [Prolixibacteraceae bacterium]|jgi:4-hydroxy-3-methylbut-2-enyl diphosphate reductase|nr:4-hydroxy-3-methylbut-2-enyl diphosphate reductase [Prolixibacteraceae bacterium]
MKIEIDNKSGFCFGVSKAITKAEELLANGENLLCLGDIVHNRQEVGRLTQLGMTTKAKDEIQAISNSTILIRSHGEPPSTYASLKENNNKIIDATCPVVLKLQQRVKDSYQQLLVEKGQLVIFGKKGHPEVDGLVGQTNNTAFVVTTVDDLKQLDFTKTIELYCQTTMPLDSFQAVVDELNKAAKGKVLIHDTICRQVSNRVPHLQRFSKQYDVILFVSGKKSSNGKLLFQICKEQNLNSYTIAAPNEVNVEWFKNCNSIGICGATSTPHWLMEKVKLQVKLLLNL